MADKWVACIKQLLGLLKATLDVGDTSDKHNQALKLSDHLVGYLCSFFIPFIHRSHTFQSLSVNFNTFKTFPTCVTTYVEAYKYLADTAAKEKLGSFNALEGIGRFTD